jgi:predicted XRE-type DNA-binding protein
MAFRKVNNITEFDNLVKSFVANRKILKSNIDGVPLTQEQQESKTLPSQIEQKVENELKKQALTQKPTTDALAIVDKKISDLTDKVVENKPKQLRLVSSSKKMGVVIAHDAKQTELRYYKVDGENSQHLGRLGVNGIINTDELSNNKVVVYKNTELEDSETWDLTDGLRFLLIKSSASLEGLSQAQKDIITKSDVEKYYNILKYAGIDAKSHRNKKIMLIKSVLGLAKLDTVKNTKRVKIVKTPKKAKTKSDNVIPKQTIKIKIQKGDGIVLSSVDDAISKLQVMVGSQNSGNNSSILKNQINSVMDYLLNKNAINHDEHKVMYDSYVK